VAIIWATTGLESKTTEGANILVPNFYHKYGANLFEYVFDQYGRNIALSVAYCAQKKSMTVIGNTW